MTTTYVLHVRRPNTDAIEVYTQEADSVGDAIADTRGEFKARNNQMLPPDHVILVADREYLKGATGERWKR